MDKDLLKELDAIIDEAQTRVLHLNSLYDNKKLTYNEYKAIDYYDRGCFYRDILNWSKKAKTKEHKEG